MWILCCWLSRSTTSKMPASQGAKGTRTVQLVDVPGHPRVRGGFQAHLSTARGVVFVLDSVDFLPHKTEIAECTFCSSGRPHDATKCVPAVDGERWMEVSSSGSAATIHRRWLSLQRLPAECATGRCSSSLCHRPSLSIRCAVMLLWPCQCCPYVCLSTADAWG